MQVIGENVRTAYVGMGAMSDGLTTLVTDASAGSSGWPFVTFSNFPSLARDARNVTGALQIVFVPIVEESERIEWETYSEENNGWLREEDMVEYNDRERRYRALLEHSNKTSPLPGADIAALIHGADTFRYPVPDQQQPDAKTTQPAASDTRQLHEGHDFRGVIPERIHPAPTREERLTPGMRYAPVWQMSPVPYYRGIINHDMLREPSFQLLNESVAKTRQATLSSDLHNDLVSLLSGEHNPLIDELGEVSGTTATFDNDNDHHRNGDPPPTSVMVQPVWESLDVNPNLVGYQIALIPWESYLIDTFHPTSDESVLIQYDYREYSPCDVKNPSTYSSSDEETSQEFVNYKVRGGDNVDYLGPGEEGFTDQEIFDYSMRRTMDFPVRAPPARANLLVANATSSNAQPPTPNCGHLRVNLYPSDELRSVYMTKWPSTYAGLVVVVFVILVSAFVIYDFTVERRRGKTMAVAEKTSRIVSSLFPSHFADQLISDTKKKEKEAKRNSKKKKKAVIEEAPTRQLKKYMKDKDKKYKKLNGTSNPNINGSSADVGLGYGHGASNTDDSPLFLAQSKPIADLFPETTVLFTDIAGE